MIPQNHLQNIIIVGASGTIGTHILSHLLALNTFNLTILTRSDSPSTFPTHPSLTIKKGSYTDPTFLHAAFTGQDAAVFALGFNAMGSQPGLIEAAARAGVEWILPTEYAHDGLNEGMRRRLEGWSLGALEKSGARARVEELASVYEGVKWIGVATNPWPEFCLQQNALGFKIASRTATLYAGSGRFNSTTLSQAGLGISRLLSLPLTNPSNPRASLSHYANNFVYLSSFLITQEEIFAALQRATGTLEGDWEVERSSIAELERSSLEGLRSGDFRAGMGLVFVNYLGEGNGGDYEVKAREDREVLGLEEESLDEVVRSTVQAVEREKGL